MDIFALNDYRAILKTSLLDRKEHFPKAYTFQKMAEACRIQKTYLSTVLNDSANLNSDQVYLACEFLGFTALQTEYTTLLHDYDRSVVPKRKREILARVNDCRRRADRSEAHLEAEVVGKEDELGGYTEYYLNPLCILAHMYLTVDKYATDVRALAEKLAISENSLSRLLSVLGKLGVVEMREGRYHVLKSTLHLSPESFVFPVHCKLMRMKTLERLDRIEGDTDSAYTFSVTFSGDETTRAKLQASFMKFLKSAQALVKNAPSKDVYQINFDLFPW